MSETSKLQETFIHPTAIVESGQIGEGTRIWAFTHVMRDASIGKGCNIGEHCYLESGAAIGNNVTIKNGNMVWEGVKLEDGVFVGPNVVFTNDLYPRSPRLSHAQARYADRRWLEPTVVKRGASLGAGAIILAGVTIGEFSMIGAGSLVTRSVQPHALVVGVPARPRSWVCRCGQPLVFWNLTARCAVCHLEFRSNGDSVDIHPALRPRKHAQGASAR